MSTTQELHDWLNGTATGGPNGDGRYPLTGSDGVTVLVLCPAAQAGNPTADPEPVEVFADSASASAAAAALSETAAAASAASAHTDAQTATTKAGEAAAAASTATTKAGEASASAAAADSSASTATTKANDAATSATDAASSASSATDSANEAHSWALTAQSSATGLLRYMPGGWDASTGAFPTDPPTGGFWKITTAGVISGVDLAVGDQIIWSGQGWDKIDNTESVTSVANRVGAVTLSIPDISGLGATLDGKATSAQGAKADTAVQPGQSLNLTAADGQITLSSPGQRQIGIVSTQTPRVGFYDITNSTWLVKIEADNSTTFAGSATVNTYLNSSTTNMVMSSSGAGGAVYLRPAGPGSVAGQLFVSTGGVSWDGKSLWHTGNFDPATKQNALGFTPVQQGTGIGQLPNNVVKIGWKSGSKLGLTIDSSDIGNLATESWVSSNFPSNGTAAGYATKANPTFTGTMNLPTGAGTCTIAPGTGDGASYTTYNIKISSWWGIGFATYDGSINGFYDARAGRWDTKGGYRVNGQDVWHAGNFNPAAKLNTNTGIGLDHNNTWLGVADIPGSGAYGLFVDTNNNVIMTYNWQHKLSVGAGGVFIDDAAVWHAGNLNPATFATAAQGAKADAALPAANLSGFTKFAVVTALPGSPDPNTVYFVK